MICKTYFITDHLGSTRVITDNAGNIKEQNDYYPFGMRHTNANLMISANRWGFNGKEKQVTQNLNYLDYGARMYDDFLGRWFVIDPLAEKYYSVSGYVYCLNNPVNIIDPDGKKIKFAQGSAWQFMAKFAQAAVHLYLNNSAGLLIKTITSPNIYTIKEGTLSSKFSSSTKTITWDANMGFITNEGHVLSPTTVLNHELDHSVQYDQNPQQYSNDGRTHDDNYGDKEEKRVITGSEQATAKNLGEIKEGEVTRADHEGSPYITTGPISTKGKDEIDGATVTAPRTQPIEPEDERRRR